MSSSLYSQRCLLSPRTQAVFARSCKPSSTLFNRNLASLLITTRSRKQLRSRISCQQAPGLFHSQPKRQVTDHSCQALPCAVYPALWLTIALFQILCQAGSPRSDPPVQVTSASISEPARKNLANAAAACRRFGWLSFWTQLVLSVVSAIILLFSVAFTSLVGSLLHGSCMTSAVIA